MSEEAEAEDNLPSYAVRLTNAVTEQTRAAFFRINDAAGIDSADAWQNTMDAVWAPLATLPYRCPVAEEDRFYQRKHPGPPLRVFVYQYGRSAWQILFTIHEADGSDPATVIIRQFRHAAQRPLTKWPDENQAT